MQYVLNIQIPVSSALFLALSLCSSHVDHLWYWASGRNVYITHVIFLLFLNIPIFQRILDKRLCCLYHMLCLKCGIFLYSWQHINDIRNCSMFTYCEVVTLLDYMLFTVLQFLVLPKVLNFSMTYFAKNIIRMNYGMLCHYVALSTHFVICLRWISLHFYSQL